MAKNPAPFNGPSKTGNPSGGGRGNNSAWNDDDDAGGTGNGGGGGYSLAGRLTSAHTDLSHIGSRPEPRTPTRGDIKRHFANAEDEEVMLITQTTHSQLLGGLIKLYAAYYRPGSKVSHGMSARDIKKHADDALDAVNRARSRRFDLIALLVRKARSELSAEEAEKLEKRALQQLDANQRQFLSKKLAFQEGLLSRGIRRRVTIPQLLAYLEI